MPSLLESMELAFASCDLLPSQSLDGIDLAWMGKVADCCSTLADVHRLLVCLDNEMLAGRIKQFSFLCLCECKSDCILLQQ